ncbi:MAG TPA: PocR ligand-binding domain-containing protein [Thermodesulfobacteriota bacterium]|nr:PocR ligand-binding domain-containing protein [Thermodesulfobacteriota bacterium]
MEQTHRRSEGVSNGWIPQRGMATEMVEKNLFLRILDSFQEAMKLQVRLFPMKGKEGIDSLDGDGHPFCQIIRSRSLGRTNCLKEINRAIQISLKTGEPYIFQCHADMIEFTTAPLNGRDDTSAFVCGPILLRHPDSFFKHDLLVKVKGLSLDKTSLIRTLSEIPVFSERRVQAAADLLFMIATYFSKIDSLSHLQHHEISRQQALLGEELFLSKIFESEPEDLSFSDLHSRGEFSRENELIDLIKLGDRKKAKVLLDEMIGTALFRSHEHIGILKARALEIIFIVARAAVEAGANLEEILGFKYQCIQNLSKDDSQETLYYFLMKAFDQLFECIYQNRNIQHTRIFTKAKEYIWNNYNQEVSLKHLAAAVGINPCYLSHLFRKEMGISFLEYLTTVRMSIAKNLLKQTAMSIMEVCLEVGYQDPSHFAKIFKKREGIHPTEYRKKLIEQI